MTKPEEFLGLTRKDASNRAEMRNLIFRLIRIDSKDFFTYPAEDDIRTDRICIEIDNGKVSKAIIQ